MKKIFTSGLVLAALLGAVVPAAAYDDGFGLRNRFICFNFGVSRALWSELLDEGGTPRTEYKNPEWLYMFGMRFWIFRFGFGMDYTNSEVLGGVFAYNLYYRVLLGRQIAILGGVGLSMSMDDDFNIGLGYNLRLGAELLLTSEISVAAVTSWDTLTMFSYLDTYYSTQAPRLKLASFSLQVNFYLF